VNEAIFMDIFSIVPGLSLKREDEGPEYEIIFKGSELNNRPYHEDEELIFNPHQMLGDTIGDVNIFSNNPYGPKEIDDEVSSVKALKLFDDAGEYVAEDNDGEFNIRYNIHRWDDGRVEYTMSVESSRTGINNPDYTTRKGRRGTSFNGKLAENVDREEIEEFVSQYGFDRHKDGWKFDNLEGELEEFLEPEDYANVFETSSEAVQRAVVSGEVRSAKYLGNDYSHWSDSEIVGALLGESLDSPEVHELEHSGRFNYEILIEDDEIMDGEGVRLNVLSTDPLFSQEIKGKEDKVAEAAVRE